MDPKNHGPARTPAGGFWIEAGWTNSLTGLPIVPMRLDRPPRFIPAHRAKGYNSKGESEWDEPDKISGQRGWFRPKRGRVDEIRSVDDPKLVAAIEALDAEEAALAARERALRAERTALFGEAWAFGTPVRVEDVKPKETAR